MSIRFKFDELDELDMDDMRLEQQAMRWYQQALAAHPDCRDPDHPGCEKCMGADDDDYQQLTYGGK